MRDGLHKLFVCVGITCLLIIGVFGCNRQDVQKNSNDSTTQIATTQEQMQDTESTVQKKETEPMGFSLSVTNSNSWESNEMVCTQFDGVIRNNTDVDEKNWKVTIVVPDGSKLENSWNGTYNLTGTTLEITPADYNSEIMSDGEVSFGFILDTPDSYSPSQVVLEVAGIEYAMDSNKQSNVTSQATTEMQTNATTQEVDTETKSSLANDVSGTPVSNHGALSVKGTHIVDKNGQIFQLKGVSTHGINWFPEYVNKEAFSDLMEYGVNAIRLAMYTADYNGYCSGGNQAELEKIMDEGVQACTDLGLYVIVDWHILNDNDPNQNKDTAKIFFDKMSKKYADNENVIYEICNEPNGGTSWESIKSYAEEVIPVIRMNDKDALIIVGTPNWSQDVDIASKNPISNQENILYAVHFYAATHKDSIRSKVQTALGNGLPIIVSESSICEASGNGSINYDEGKKWMDLILEYQLSCFAWSLGNKDESSSFLKSSVTKKNGFTLDDFSETGKWYLEQYSK